MGVSMMVRDYFIVSFYLVLWVFDKLRDKVIDIFSSS